MGQARENKHETVVLLFSVRSRWPPLDSPCWGQSLQSSFDIVTFPDYNQVIPRKILRDLNSWDQTDRFNQTGLTNNLPST